MFTAQHQEHHKHDIKWDNKYDCYYLLFILFYIIILILNLVKSGDLLVTGFASTLRAVRGVLRSRSARIQPSTSK